MLHLLGAAAIPALALAPGRLDALGFEAARRVARAVPTGFFSESQLRTVDQIAELILPRTDTPGARDAGVARFIEVVVAEWDIDADRTAFMRGLADVDARSRSVGGRPFLELETAQQGRVLEALEAEGRTAPTTPVPFFERMKRLTLFGYYSSEVAIQEELGEVFMPGRFEGDAPLRTRSGGT